MKRRGGQYEQNQTKPTMTITRVLKLYVRVEGDVIGINQFELQPRQPLQLVLSVTHNALVEGHHQDRIDAYTGLGVKFTQAVLNKVLDYIKSLEERPE